jgi:peptidoglycan/LPS O-acetylase OafA/YrhL
VAALAVVLFHLQYSQSGPPSWLSSMTTHFYLSVHLFFVVSAFSLYH